MPMLHDPVFRESAKARLRSLRPDAPRRWGKMSVDQMLWHVNTGLENALGRYAVAKISFPLPSFVMKFIVISLPWRKGKTPTAPEFVASSTHDFEHERARLFQLIDECAAKPLDAKWNDSAYLGRMTGREWSRLLGKHLDYHLQQFGA
ncbi:MAG TPA: hypothetical protein VI485_17845 [Vicinamibacterales bacterium]|nr:hypothetical protein [Vicinamibacterales bacterium]